MTTRAPSTASVNKDVRGMQIIATGLLVLMACVYFTAKANLGLHPAIGFVKAFAEAAMVGGMADWFAVTALFRHPLGLPIPHTAIIPRNKDRIGETLAQFLKNNFLVPAVVARRMGRVDVAGAVGRFLADPEHGGTGRMRDGASQLLAKMLESLDQQRLGGMAKSAIANRLRALEISPLLGQALDAAMREDRHIPLLNGLILRAGDVIAANDIMIRAMVHERASGILRWTGLDENVANAIIGGLNKLFAEMAENPDHPLREKANALLADLAEDLQHDPVMKTRVADLKSEIVDNPAMKRWIDGLWEQARDALLKAAHDPDRAMAGKFGEILAQLGMTLQQDERLRQTINRFARRTTVGATARYGDVIVRLISDTVRGWDAEKITSRVENAVGRDLQYIRINGTVVGGLVGLLIHIADIWL